MLRSEDISKLTELFRDISKQIRSGGGSVDDPMVTAIERAVIEIRKASDAKPASTPPDAYKSMLWAAGKCTYDTSWSLLSQIEAAWGITHHTGSVETAPTIQRLAEVARTVPWPQYAPHALGAIRCQALMESKRDTADGYDRAWLFHREAIKRYGGYKENLRGAEKAYAVGLDDTFIQLGLAETGTACRQAERIIGRWAEEFGKLDGSNIQDTWLQLLFNNLREGAEIGERTLATVDTTKATHGLVEEVTDERMALVTAYRQPGVMTARALLLLAPLCSEMERMGQPLPGDKPSAKVRDDFLDRAERAYRRIVDTSDRDYSQDHLRSLVQLRLNLALIAPGRSMPLANAPLDCLALDPLDDDAVAALSGWLAARENDANGIGSATMPAYIRAIETARKDCKAAAGGYRKWRMDWPKLDRYHKEEGRAVRVEQALDESADVGAE